MPRITCPKCKNRLEATEEQRGAVVTCTACQCRLKVPPRQTDRTGCAGRRPGRQGRGLEKGRGAARPRETAIGARAGTGGGCRYG